MAPLFIQKLCFKHATGQLIKKIWTNNRLLPENCDILQIIFSS